MDAGQLEQFEQQIGMRIDPEKEALKALKAFQEAQGLVFEDPDAPVAGFRKVDRQIVAYEEGKDEELGGYMGGR